MSVHLPIIPEEPASSLRSDGRRNFVYPADVEGRFTTLRKVIFTLLIGVLVALPSIPVGGHPAVFLDVEHRRFFLFGQSFNAQDFWLVFFLLTGIGFSLIFVTTLWGRVWCGYACPQTVFLEGLYRRIERWLEGSRVSRMRKSAGPWTLDKTWRALLKHIVYVVLSLFLAHVFLSYFVSIPSLLQMVQKSPAEHPEAFAWSVCVAGILYGNFAWFREQMCLIVCPYGRLQSVLTDQDSWVIGYDVTRGEPRGKVTEEKAGDCIDCGRCVVVCPTGIDIRNGLQIDCIACAACIDACDDIMTKVGRPVGLIRYDSLAGLAGKRRRVWRPRVFFYIAAGVLGLTVASLALFKRTPYEAVLLRLPGSPYVVENNEIRNSFEVHLVNKSDAPVTFHITTQPNSTLHYVIPLPIIQVPSLGNQRVPVFVILAKSNLRPGLNVQLRVTHADSEWQRLLQAAFTVPVQ